VSCFLLLSLACACKTAPDRSQVCDQQQPRTDRVRTCRPYGAAGSATLAGHFTDLTVVTYDPRGSGRSGRTDGASETTPDEHADDLHRLTRALDAGPVDLFATSGGAVNALALVAKHPEQVRTLVAHEPPAAQELPDERLGTAPVTFPGGHDGFLGGEYGSTGEPDAFAATLREVLAN
jgi:pimeloyl-ACP methyl ester carboxylesterase